MLLTLVATVLLLIGCLAVYAATKHQALLAKPAPPPVGMVGGGLILSALAAFLCVAGPATAVFIWMTATMLVWSLVPIAAKWIRWKTGESR